MAFQQPIARPVRRTITPPPVQTATPPRKAPETIRESEEWILFSPQPRHTASDSLQTPRTAARSRFSDLGSLNTAAESGQAADEIEDDDEAISEDLDSLDDGLHAFCERVSSEMNQAPASSADPVLPTHDGLGLFPGDSSPMQAQVWQHERQNPARRRYSMRRSSLQRKFDALDEEERYQARTQDERFERIEAWRLEQSRAIMDEIEKQSRRRRRRSRLSGTSLNTSAQTDTAQVNSAEPTGSQQPRARQSPESESEPEGESFWTRLTRRVIRNLMGIDEATLSYIFGEALPPGVEKQENLAAGSCNLDTLGSPRSGHLAVLSEADSWEERMLARISRELGVLVHEISRHSGAFSTFIKTQEQPTYAGLPTPPAFIDVERLHRTQARQRKMPKHRRRASAAKTDPSLFGIEEEAEDENELTPQASRQETSQLKHDREYWEQDLDVKMVFGYLRSRLSSSPSRTPTPTNDSSCTPLAATSMKATSTFSPHDPLRRAALIRHHHPLVSTITGRAQNVSATFLSPSPVLGRRSNSFVDGDGLSSCASRSSKKSKTKHSGSLSVGSSRNSRYWDIGRATWGEV